MLEPPALVAGLDDVAVMGEPIEQRGGHFGIAEHGRPFAERQVGGDDDRGVFVKSADEMEQQLPASAGERQIAQFVEDQEVEPRQMLGELSGAALVNLHLEPVYKIGRVVEANARSEEHTSELQSLMRISYAVFCLKKKITQEIDK